MYIGTVALATSPFVHFGKTQRPTLFTVLWSIPHVLRENQATTWKAVTLSKHGSNNIKREYIIIIKINKTNCFHTFLCNIHNFITAQCKKRETENLTEDEWYHWM
jgi:hypothetical protein